MHYSVFNSSYIVEKRDKNGGDWETVSDAVPGTSVVVNKLKEGREYEFRVKAVNPHGVSEPLVTEKGTLAKDPFGKQLNLN